jgi:hypothetical protein
MSAVKGLEKEQERDGKISNPEIDPEKTHLNYDLVQSELNLYQRVKKRVEEVKPVSRIQKNSVVDCSNIITVPQEQFKEWGIEKSKEYLKEVYNYFCKEFGKENVLSAKVHLDETTPHMHLHFTPVSLEGKLQARKVITREKLNKVHNEAPKYLQEKGFDVVRGEGKTTKSLEIKEFKAKKLEDRIEELEKALIEAAERHKNTLKQFQEVQDSVKQQFESLKNTSKSLSKLSEHTKGVIGKLDKIEVKKNLLGGKLSISEQDYSNLISLAKIGESKSLENLQLKTKVNTLEGKLNELENTKTLEDSMRNSQLERLQNVDYDYRLLKKNTAKLINDYRQIEQAIDNLGLKSQVDREIKSIKIKQDRGMER